LLDSLLQETLSFRMSVGKLRPPFPPVPPIPSGAPNTSVISWSGDAMDTLKMKIGLLRKDDSESRAKMEAAEAAQEEADGRIKEAENRIRELSKKIHSTKIQLDEKTDQCARNVASCKRKEEATIAAKEEIKMLNLKEMTLKAELERVGEALPNTLQTLCSASEVADKELGDLKQLEIRAMLADQTIEEMEEQLHLANNMAHSSTINREEIARKLEVRDVDLRRATQRANRAQEKLESVTEKLRIADRKMASLQYRLEDRGATENKYKKQLCTLQARVKDAEVRLEREVNALNQMKNFIDIRISRAKK